MTTGRDYFVCTAAATPVTVAAASHKNTKRGEWHRNPQRRRRPPRGPDHANIGRVPALERREIRRKRIACRGSVVAQQLRPATPSDGPMSSPAGTTNTMRNGAEHVPTHLCWHTDQTSHGTPLSQSWGDRTRDDHTGGALNESPPRRERPYNYTRGNTASMALEWLPPTCVAGRDSRGKWSRCSDGWYTRDDEFWDERPVAGRAPKSCKSMQNGRRLTQHPRSRGHTA